jgi:hypothetical protein
VLKEKKAQPLQPFEQFAHLPTHQRFHWYQFFYFVCTESTLNELVIPDVFIVLCSAKIYSPHRYAFREECIEQLACHCTRRCLLNTCDLTLQAPIHPVKQGNPRAKPIVHATAEKKLLKLCKVYTAFIRRAQYLYHWLTYR